MMSSADRWLRSSTAVTSSAEPSSTASRVSASTWIAPRMARTLTDASQPHRPVQRSDLRVAEPAEPAGSLVAQLHLAHRGAQEPQHRVADLLQQPPHDVLAAFVDHQLDHRPARVRVDQAEPVDHRGPVLQLDALAQPTAEVTR